MGGQFAARAGSGGVDGVICARSPDPRHVPPLSPFGKGLQRVWRAPSGPACARHRAWQRLRCGIGRAVWPEDRRCRCRAGCGLPAAFGPLHGQARLARPGHDRLRPVQMPDRREHGQALPSLPGPADSRSRRESRRHPLIDREQPAPGAGYGFRRGPRPQPQRQRGGNPQPSAQSYPQPPAKCPPQTPRLPPDANAQDGPATSQNPS